MSTQKQYKYTLPIGYRLHGGEKDYVIEEVLGKGGFGVTYKVKTTVQLNKLSFDVHCAVKEYFPDICSRKEDYATINIPETKQQEIADGIKDFINEGKKLQAVCDLNPNIVNVNEVFQANGTAYYVLEYLEGGDLRKMVKNNGGALTEQQMLDVMVPIGLAVQCLHDNNILHLDIKPDNIVMRRNSDGDEEPVLIDFGIAVHFTAAGTPTSKAPSQGLSPGYSPIEQYMLVKVFDPRIDVYAFCATCLYLLTGRDPREASLDLPADYVTTELPATVSPNVARAIEHGMSMNKNTRTGSIREVLAEFGVSEENPVAVPTKKSQSHSKPDGTINLHARNDALRPVSEPADEPEEKTVENKKLMVALAIVLAMALIAGIVLLSKGCGTSDKSGSESSIIASESSIIASGEDDIINGPAEQTFTVDGVSFTMVKVQGGTFTMGATSEQGSDADSDEKPAHSVTVSSYYIGQTEVTQELWQAVMGNNPSYFKGTKRPVEQVSWDDCQEFLRKLNQKTGKNFRLPTEAEWEYAARGGNKSQGYKYSGSNTIGDVAWYDVNCYDKGSSSPDYGTHQVATKRVNELGINDMSGNVWEWCSDWDGDYSSSSQTNPTGPASGFFRVYRGGSWSIYARNCRVSNRSRSSAGHRRNYLGLRLAL